MKKIALCAYALYRPLFYLLVILDTTILGIITIVASCVDPRGNRVHYIGKFRSRLNMLLSGVRVRMIHPDGPGRPDFFIIHSDRPEYF